MKKILKKTLLVSLLHIFLQMPAAGQDDASDSLRTYQLNQVVVTGARMEAEKADLPYSITVVGEETIEESHKPNVLQAINGRTPGLFINERSLIGYGVGPRSGGGISIRGLSSSGDPANTRTLALIDGQPQFMGLFGHPIHDAYFSSDVERVEIIRGPASVLYGTNAMGGAVNLITKRQAEDGWRLRGSAAYGSFQAQHYKASAGFKSGDFDIYAAVNRAGTDGHRERAKDDFYTTAGFIKSAWKLSDAFSVGVDGNISDSRFYDPGPVSENFQDHFFDYTRGRGSVFLENTFQDLEGAFKAFYTFGTHDFHDGFRSDDYNRGIAFYQNLEWARGQVFTLGLDYKNFGGIAENTIAGVQLVDQEVHETDVYAMARQTLWDRLTLNAGLRLTNNSVYGGETIPQFGAAYQIAGGSVVKASAAKGFRSPTVVNLYFVGANPDLEPERMWNYEASYLQSLLRDKLSLEATAFISRGDNLIRMIPTSPGEFRNVNTGEFEHKGFEFQGTYAASRQLNFMLTYSLLAMDDPLPYAPRNQVALHADFSIQKLKTTLSVKNVSGLVVGAVQAPVDTSLPKENYTLVNLTADYSVVDGLSVFVQGENLLDADYQIDAGYPLPGISVMGGVHFAFGN